MLNFILGLAALLICYTINKILGIVVTLSVGAFLVYTYLPSWHATKGNQAYAAGDVDSAVKFYEKAYATGRATSTVKNSYVFLLLRQGDAEKAEAIVDSVINDKRVKQENKNDARRLRCMLYSKTGRLGEAIEDAEEMFSEYKNSALYAMLGYFKILSGEPIDELIEFCEEAYDYNADDRDITDNMAIVYLKAGRLEEAKDCIDGLMETNPAFVEAFYHAAQIYAALGKLQEAVGFLDKIPECKRSCMTTVSETEIEELRGELSDKKV